MVVIADSYRALSQSGTEQLAQLQFTFYAVSNGPMVFATASLESKHSSIASRVCYTIYLLHPVNRTARSQGR